VIEFPSSKERRQLFITVEAENMEEVIQEASYVIETTEEAKAQEEVQND
jgi:hypothetical protein